ncbi:MAG: ribosome biogenesis GTPase YlqF [Proteobacteria bacterium]|uniref:ribosome biogenesis GTPase YlqF n=1 Tax=Aquabacterium sp. TaxID=1872578 RepID=UPI0035C77791|nr:ribosome biogenesis GTPase YlqF [Pseudomonadota bacterium]
MAIQWFPGHMHVTKKAILERIKDIDVVIELLDARLPGSSANPMLAAMTGHRLKLKVLNKQDLADPARTEAWLAWYRAQSDTAAIALDASDTAPAQRLVKACRELAPHRGGMAKPLRVLICGIPNVGKSTLLNTLVGKKAAKTGDEAGVTRIEQRINLASDFYLFDTPGMLWPKIIVEKSGYHLAGSGAVGRNAYDEEEVALELIQSLKGPYAPLLVARYKLDTPEAEIPAMHDEALLTEIGRKRGAVMSGGRVNLQKAAEIVINDFRSAAIGRATLETPAEFEAWLQAAQAHEATLQAERAARNKKHKRRHDQEEAALPRPEAGDGDHEDANDSED